jgi:DNA-directed RNA polymerase subunit M/transcription elongation factor TFIIS
MFDSLSEFMKERNQNMLNSFEAKLRESIQILIDLRSGRKKNQVDTLDPPTEEDAQLGSYTFTNESIKDALVNHSEAEEDSERKGLYHSAEIGSFGQAKITTVLKSKFKAKVGLIKKINNKTHRCVEFKQTYLNRLKTSYEVEDKIRIVRKEKKEKVTPVTLVTPLGELSPNNLNDFERENERKNEEKEGEYSSRGVTTVTTVTEEETKQKPRQKATCPKCGYTDDAFYMKNHHCEGTD